MRSALFHSVKSLISESHRLRKKRTEKKSAYSYGSVKNLKKGQEKVNCTNKFTPKWSGNNKLHLNLQFQYFLCSTFFASYLVEYCPDHAPTHFWQVPVNFSEFSRHNPDIWRPSATTVTMSHLPQVSDLRGSWTRRTSSRDGPSCVVVRRRPAASENVPFSWSKEKNDREQDKRIS